MTFYSHRILSGLAVAALLAGCSGSPSGSGDSVIQIPSRPPPPYTPPVSESYIIQTAPRPVTVETVDVFEVTAAENARREAEARRNALAVLEARAKVQKAAPTLPPAADPLPFEAGQPTAPAAAPDMAALAKARASAAAAEASATALAAELAQARAAVVEAEANAALAESEAQRAVRERVAQLAAERVASQTNRTPPQTSRANPPVPDRPVLGRFTTRNDAAQTVARSQPAAPARPVPAPVAPAPPRPIVEQAPIPGLKPYILARSAFPSAKPRRAAPSRSFDVGQAATLSAPGIAAIAPAEVAIPAQTAGADLSARFFPTPGKPSTRGTDRDTQLDLASIDATPYGVGTELSTTVEGDATSARWADAVTLIENGEVEALAINEDSDLILTLCSGRSILTTPPDLTAAATLTAPQIICGQNKPLALR